MARKASEFTKAIRRLCEKTNFGITYATARPRLIRMGIEVAPEPPKKSDVYKKWEEHRGKYPKNPERLLAYYKSTTKAAGLPSTMVEAIMKEDAPHRAFRDERNYFDVTKWNYHQRVGETISSKPPVSITKKGGRPMPENFVTESKPVQRPVKVVVDSDAIEALKCLLENGGAEGVEKKMAQLKAEVARLSKVLEKAAALHKVLPAA
jgi:hypothetical protein